jgi:type II secretory pathway component PulM
MAGWYFWSSWPMASQQRLFRMVNLGTLVVSLSVFIGLGLFGNTVEQQIAEAKEQYGRVLPLVEEIRAFRAQQGNLAHLPVDEAVWDIIDTIGIEPQVTSFRTTRLSEHETGVQVTLTGLTLPRLTDFLRDLRERASLQSPDCTISRNQDDPRLADAHLVLAR